LKVLIVEDDIRIAKPLMEELQHQHMIVNLALDGEAAWDMHLGESYDLILLDLMLPKLSLSGHALMLLPVATVKWVAVDTLYQRLSPDWSAAQYAPVFL